MQHAKIRVLVEPGVFKSERSVSFKAGDRTYALLVDEQDVQGNTLVVQVIGENQDEVWIDLPREDVNAGKRIKLPKDSDILELS